MLVLVLLVDVKKESRLSAESSGAGERRANRRRRCSKPSTSSRLPQSSMRRWPTPF
jgi:hypothetical protein